MVEFRRALVVGIWDFTECVFLELLDDGGIRCDYVPDGVTIINKFVRRIYIKLKP